MEVIKMANSVERQANMAKEWAKRTKNGQNVGKRQKKTKKSGSKRALIKKA